MMLHHNKEYNVISLFSGAGGMSLGFANAGIKPAFAADIDLDACSTYEKNLGVASFNCDISNSDFASKIILFSTTTPLALIGGPPCQGFSSAGSKNGSDKRNELIFNYLNIVSTLKPRWFLFENVEGILTSNGGKSLYDLVCQFIKIGYRLRLKKFNFAAFGIPQARKRVILMGNSIGMDFDFPSQTHSFNSGKHKSYSRHSKAPSFDEAVAGLGHTTENLHSLSEYSAVEPLNDYDHLMRAGNTKAGVTLHCAWVNDKKVDIYTKLPSGKTMKDLPPEYWHESYKRRANRRVKDGTPTEKRGGAPSGIKRLIGNLNSLTITSAATREFIHPRENRPLTLREAARLQSFPDRFEFSGGTTSISRQIGNAFPPIVAQIFAEHIIELDGKVGSDSLHRSGRKFGAGLIGFGLTEAGGMSPALMKSNALLEQLCNVRFPLPFEDRVFSA